MLRQLGAESSSDAYAAHATVIRILSQADLVPEEVFGDGLQLLFSIAEAMTTGMTAASPAPPGRQPEHAELTALACLMMLERVNYLISAEVPAARGLEMAEPDRGHHVRRVRPHGRVRLGPRAAR